MVRLTDRFAAFHCVDEIWPALGTGECVLSASAEAPIAVVGMGCHFPGGADRPGALWDIEAGERDTAGKVPTDRWDADWLAALHDPDVAVRAGRGCFLDGDVWSWEPAAFSVAPIEQDAMDPQFRLLLEVAWEAVTHAGIPVDQVRGSRTGVWMGTYSQDNLLRAARPATAPNSPYLFGNSLSSCSGWTPWAASSSSNDSRQRCK